MLERLIGEIWKERKIRYRDKRKMHMIQFAQNCKKLRSIKERKKKNFKNFLGFDRKNMRRKNF